MSVTQQIGGGQAAYGGRPSLAPKIASSGPIGVTVVSPSYAHLQSRAVAQFQRFTGFECLTLSTSSEPAFAAKLNLDLVCPHRQIIYFDVDWVLLRKFDFTLLAESGKFCAVPDPCAFDPRTFPHTDSEREGWDKSTYFNSGLFVCDLSLAAHRRVFSDARMILESCHGGCKEPPADWTDQFFLNAALQLQPGLLERLPFSLNFFKLAVDWGSYPAIPREVIGLHAAGVPVEQKEAVLDLQSRVFGQPSQPLLPGVTSRNIYEFRE